MNIHVLGNKTLVLEMKSLVKLTAVKSLQRDFFQLYQLNPAVHVYQPRHQTNPKLLLYFLGSRIFGVKYQPIFHDFHDIKSPKIPDLEATRCFLEIAQLLKVQLE